MLVVNYVDITGVKDDLYRVLKNEISAGRRAKADQYFFLDDAKRCVLAELLLQYCLYHRGNSLKNIKIGYNTYGKPSLESGEDFSFNISHSGKWVVIAYGKSQAEIGIDIEKICTEQEGLPISSFTREEQDYINEAVGEQRLKRFTKIWTLKESYVKYVGTGLSTDLDSFSILVEDAIKVRGQDGIDEAVNLESHLFQTDYYLSTCSVEEEVTLCEIELEDLIEFINLKKQDIKI